MEATVLNFTKNNKKVIHDVLQKMNDVQSEINFTYVNVPAKTFNKLSDIIEIETAFVTIENIRRDRKYNQHLICVFDKPFDNNWFSITNHKLKDSIITIADWEILSH